MLLINVVCLTKAVSHMSCKLKGMQGFQNVLKYIAADSGKVGGCGNQDCLSQADCYDQI